jgi:steroid delta-isomerase-like uncharacterized protein
MDAVSARNKIIIQQFIDAWNRHDADMVASFVDPNVVRHCPATPNVEVRNADQLKAFLHQDTAVFPDSRQTIARMVAEADLVSAWVTYEGTQRGPMGPLPATNRTATFDFAAIFRVDHGKITEWWVTWDNLGILQQLGHLPGA